MNIRILSLITFATISVLHAQQEGEKVALKIELPKPSPGGTPKDVRSSILESEAQRQGDSEDAKRAVTMTVAAVDKVAAPIKIDGAPPRAAKPAAAPVAVEDDEEEEAKPIVRKNKAEEPAPAVKASLAKLAAEWDDE